MHPLTATINQLEHAITCPGLSPHDRLQIADCIGVLKGITLPAVPLFPEPRSLADALAHPGPADEEVIK